MPMGKMCLSSDHIAIRNWQDHFITGNCTGKKGYVPFLEWQICKGEMTTKSQRQTRMQKKKSGITLKFLIQCSGVSDLG